MCKTKIDACIYVLALLRNPNLEVGFENCLVVDNRNNGSGTTMAAAAAAACLKGGYTFENYSFNYFYFLVTSWAVLKLAKRNIYNQQYCRERI